MQENSDVVYASLHELPGPKSQLFPGCHTNAAGMFPAQHTSKCKHSRRGACLRHGHLQEALLEVAKLSPDGFVHLACGCNMLAGDDQAVMLRQAAPASALHASGRKSAAMHISQAAQDCCMHGDDSCSCWAGMQRRCCLHSFKSSLPVKARQN